MRASNKITRFYFDQIGVLTLAWLVVYWIAKKSAARDSAWEFVAPFDDARLWPLFQCVRRDGEPALVGGKKFATPLAICAGDHSDLWVRRPAIVSINSRSRRVHSRIPLMHSGQVPGRERTSLSTRFCAQRIATGTRVGKRRGRASCQARGYLFSF